MNLQLKDFQETAVRELMELVQMARGFSSIKPQVVSLSSPTGSGKTITMCTLIERIVSGDATFAPDSQARFLWISDSPELNEQSRAKFVAHSSDFKISQLKTIENSFDAEVFERGTVYFLNTQKLGGNSNLIHSRDERRWTLWETITNTARQFPRSFYLILDEAHRGMTCQQYINAARTIVQKFIVGDPALNLPPMPLIIGMSATPERFNALVANTGRSSHEVRIDPLQVSGSGLLKEKVIVSFADNDIPSDFTLLREAVKDWVLYRSEWRAYLQAEIAKEDASTDLTLPHRFLGQDLEETVEPVLVVQVQDGRTAARAEPSDRSVITLTDLDEAMQAISEECDQAGVPLTQRAVRHCFNSIGPIVAAGHNIEYIEPSRIQFDDAVRIVFFKAALSTGWDCPRAEVMMSFRTAHDHTLIAQLIGRMVRTPLARKVQSNEFLNTVRLYLPHYDDAGVRNVLSVLAKPDAENAPPPTSVTVKSESAIYHRRKDIEPKVWEQLALLPSYSVPRRPIRKPNPERLLALGRLIHLSGLDQKGRDEWRNAKELLLDLLKSEWQALDEATRMQARAFAKVKIHEISSVVGEWQPQWLPFAEDDTVSGGQRLIDTGQTRTVHMSPENIDDIFEECGRKLGKGEDIHRLWWKRMADEINPDDPYAAKLALYFILCQQHIWDKMRNECQKRIDDLFEFYKPQIRTLSEAKQEKFRALRMIGRRPEPFFLTMPETIVATRSGQEYQKHLFTNEHSLFSTDLKAWEQRVINSVTSDSSYIAWLRCEPHKTWSLCIPYQISHEYRPAFPDFLLLRKKNNHIEFDIVEPHSDHLSDAHHKAHGLATFAEQHGDSFGRILMGKVMDDKSFRWIDFQRDDVRQAVRRINDPTMLDSCYWQHGQIIFRS
jgi:type III restriction enzyme